MNNNISTTSTSSDPPDFTPPNSDDQGMINRQFFRTSFHYSEDQNKHSQMLLNPRKKRSKLIRIDDSTASTSSNVVGKRKYCKKPDPSAPKITRPCTECGKRFWSVKALFGHMRCHPERQWRGINPPPNFKRSSTSDHHLSVADVQYDVLPHASSMMTEEDQQVASCLLMLANAPPPAPPCSVVSDQTTNPTSVATITVRNQAVLDSGIRDYQDVFGCGDFDHPLVDHGAGPSGVSNFKFECSNCKKVFGSHQALGGHRASHKNVKGCFAINKNDGLGLGAGGGTGTPGLFGAGLPEFEQVQQQLTQNPNMMREIINTPAIQNLMNNPDLMRSLIMSNPQMREIIDRNPELAHILNDPGILRQTLEAARNPELMREMMCNTDRAMSNIESSPEGFNMLRRMYENVQEPFLNATTMGGGAGNDAGANPFAALLGNQGVGTQGTNASNNSTNSGSETAAGTTIPNSNPLPNPWGGTGGGPQLNAAARSNPTGDARAAGIGGLGGLGLPELDRTTGIPDPAMMNQLLQNPGVSQMMQSLLSNPQYMNQFLDSNPQLQSMFEMNPQLRDMMQNPDVIRQLTSPEMMQRMSAFHQALQSQQNRQQSTQDPAQTGATTAQNNMGLDLLMNMFSGLGAGGFPVPNTPDLPPEELYATQLSQLQEMGFFDTQENIRALCATSGNVHAAVERLLGNLGQ